MGGTPWQREPNASQQPRDDHRDRTIDADCRVSNDTVTLNLAPFPRAPLSFLFLKTFWVKVNLSSEYLLPCAAHSVSTVHCTVILKNLWNVVG